MGNFVKIDLMIGRFLLCSLFFLIAIFFPDGNIIMYTILQNRGENKPYNISWEEADAQGRYVVHEKK